MSQGIKEAQFLNEVELANPVSAGVLAVFPGFIIHGLGHFYIGEYSTGGLILGSEVFAFALSLVIPEDILFWGGWLYDVIASPIKASKMRKEYEQKKRGTSCTSIRFNPNK